MLQAALIYALRGINVFPLHSTDARGICSCGEPDCGSPGKHPRTAHGFRDATCDVATIRRWWTRNPDANIGVPTGDRGWVIVDADVKNGQPGKENWAAFASATKATEGVDIEDTCIVQTPSGGLHVYYRCAGGGIACSVGQLDEGIDVRAQGGYIVVPPSSIGGVAYRYLDGHGLDRLCDLPEVVADRLLTGNASRRNVRSFSAGALIPEGQRDETLFRDACAMRGRGLSQEAIEAALLKRNAEQCDPPLPESQVRAKAASAARYEPSSSATDELTHVPCDRNGWLASDGTRLVSLARIGKDEIVLRPWTNFDPRVVGVTVDDEGHRCYLTDLVRKTDGISSRLLLESSTLGNLQKLNIVLAAYGCSIVPAPKELHSRHEAARFLRFLDAQNAATYRTVAALGWQDGLGFLTHEGVITANGCSEHLDVVPHPMLANRAPYRYGFGDDQAAIAALRRLLSFHDETACSVVGSWLVACLLADKLRRYTKHFPDLGLEGSSGTGKTSGPFGDLLQLICGNTEGPCEATAASLRDRIGAHRNAPVWLDDVGNTAAIYDLLRQATSGGSRIKMASDNTHMAKTRLLAPVMISGEHLGPIHEEKAMMDRFIVVELPSPVGLCPLGDARQSRFDNLMDLRRQYRDDFTCLAGNVVQLVLQRARYVDESRKQRDDRQAREADKMAVLRVGALVLADLTGDPAHPRLIEDWVITSNMPATDTS